MAGRSRRSFSRYPFWYSSTTVLGGYSIGRHLGHGLVKGGVEGRADRLDRGHAEFLQRRQQHAMGHADPLDDRRQSILGGMRQGALQIVDDRQDLFNQGFVAIVEQFLFFAVGPLAIVFQIGPLPEETVPVFAGLLFLGRELLFRCV